MSTETTPTTQAAPAAALPNVPETWPGAFGLYKYSKQAVLRNWKLLLLIQVVSGLLSGASRDSENSFTLWSLIASILSLILGVVLMYVELESVRGKTLTGQQAFRKFNGSSMLKCLGATILTGIVTAASLIALIIPFFFVFPRVLFAPYFAVDKGLGPIDALSASWELTRNQPLHVWGVIGATILMAIGILLIVGLYFLFMYGCATAILYQYLINKQQATASAATPSSPVA